MGRIKKSRPGTLTNWSALTPKERHKLIIDCGVYNVESALGSAADRCSTAFNYGRRTVADSLQVAGGVLAGAVDVAAKIEDSLRPKD